MKINVISPATTERVLSGICYKHQWLAVSSEVRGHSIHHAEDITMDDFDEWIAGVDPDAVTVIDLSSYPQLDMVLQIEREYGRRHGLQYIGLDGLLKEHGLPIFDPEAAGLDLAEGAFHYTSHMDWFPRRKLQDYDCHVAKLEDGRQWSPGFLSVGCQRKCPYCYVGYTSFPHGFASREQISETINRARIRGHNLHFYDEDFYLHPELDFILSELEASGVKWIALATSVSLSRAIEKYGASYLVKAGNVLNEVGLETTSKAVLDKEQRLSRIFESPEINIFWLTVTFFPGETIGTKNQTGAFLKEHGYSFDASLPRMRTNSTHGGLGQFFVSYHGTPWHLRREETGYRIPGPPTRLWPTYVPKSFLQSVPEVVPDANIDVRWLDLYYQGRSSAEYLLSSIDGQHPVGHYADASDPETLVAMAQLAQLGVLKERA